MMGLRTRCGCMAIHPTMNLGHPTTEVVYLIFKNFSVHGALQGSKTRNMPAAAHALPAYRFFFSHHSSIMRVRYLPVDQCPRPFPLEPKTVCCHKFADELERYNLIYTESTISVFVTRHSVAVESQAQLCVCASEHQLVARYTIIWEERRYQINRITTKSCGTCFTSTNAQ